MRIQRTPDGRPELVLRGRDAALLFTVLLVLLIGAAGLRGAAAQDCGQPYCVGVPGVRRLAAGATETPTIGATPPPYLACPTPPPPEEGLQVWTWEIEPGRIRLCYRLFVDSRPVFGGELLTHAVAHFRDHDEIFYLTGNSSVGAPYTTIGVYEPAPGNLKIDVVVPYADRLYHRTIDVPFSAYVPPTETPVP